MIVSSVNYLHSECQKQINSMVYSPILLSDVDRDRNVEDDE